MGCPAERGLWPGGNPLGSGLALILEPGPMLVPGLGAGVSTSVGAQARHWCRYPYRCRHQCRC